MKFMNLNIFFRFQLNYLVSINGVRGDKNGSKIIKSVAHATISPTLLSKYTWSGRSSTKEKKLVLSNKVQIIDLIYHVVKAYDVNYSRSDCHDDLIYKVCKYAHQK